MSIIYYTNKVRVYAMHIIPYWFLNFIPVEMFVYQYQSTYTLYYLYPIYKLRVQHDEINSRTNS